MDDKIKGYLALGIAVAMGHLPVRAYLAKEEAKRQGIVPPKVLATEQDVNQGLLKMMLIPALLVWYGVSKLRAA